MQEPDREAVADALSRVYARPEFAGGSRTGFLQTVADLWTAFRQWLAGLLETLFDELGAMGPGIGRLLVIVLVVVAALAAVRVLRHYLVEATGRAGGEGSSAPEDAALDAAAWEARARRAREEGRLRDAALALYRAALLRLDAHGAIRFHDGKTPGDYRREMRGDPEVGPSFDRFVRILLPLAFAAGAPDVEQLDALRDVASGLGVDA